MKPVPFTFQFNQDVGACHRLLLSFARSDSQHTPAPVSVPEHSTGDEYAPHTIQSHPQYFVPSASNFCVEIVRRHLYTIGDAMIH